jgi:hypothetical protein
MAKLDVVLYRDALSRCSIEFVDAKVYVCGVHSTALEGSIIPRSSANAQVPNPCPPPSDHTLLRYILLTHR